MLHQMGFYTYRQECENIGGKNSGKCADGFGVCCVSKYNSNL